MTDDDPVVFIGTWGPKIREDDSTSARTINKIGGKPIWLRGRSPHGYPFHCIDCGSQLSLLCQLATPYRSRSRCLYIFGCFGKQGCSLNNQSWKVLRCLVDEDVPVNAKQQNGVSNDFSTVGTTEYRDFRDACNSWGESDWITASRRLHAAYSEGVVNQSSAFVNVSEAPDVQESRMELSSKGKACLDSFELPAYHIDVEEEPYAPQKTSELDVKVQSLMDDYNKREREGLIEEEEMQDRLCFCGTQVFEPESYEDSDDKVFSRFQKRLARKPNQILRYCFGAASLWLSEFSAEEKRTVKTCAQCGGGRVFEVQLMPTMIHGIQLRCQDVSTDADFRFDWGVVAIFTCENDCIPRDGYAEEQAVVEPGV